MKKPITTIEVMQEPTATPGVQRVTVIASVIDPSWEPLPKQPSILERLLTMLSNAWKNLTKN